MDPAQEPSLQSLDACSLLHIASLIPETRGLAALACTCRDIHRLLTPSRCWEHLLELRYGLTLHQIPQAPGSAAVSPTKASAGAPSHDAPASLATLLQPTQSGTASPAPAPAPSVHDASSSTPAPAPAPALLPHAKSVLRLLHRSSSARSAPPGPHGCAPDLAPLRFAAVLTDGGVDAGSLHYWADHMFIPNSWAPYCSRLSENVSVFAVLKTGKDATAELTHRCLLISCLKWVLPLLQLQPLPPNPETYPLDKEQVEEAAAMLESWKTLRLESLFCQMAARVAHGDPLGGAMLRGLPGSHRERRTAAMALGAGIQVRTWYDRNYKLHFLPAARTPLEALARVSGASGSASAAASARGALQALAAAGGPVGAMAAAAAAAMPGAAAAGGSGPGPRRPTSDVGLDSAYVMDERAVREELMTTRPANAVALLEGMALSREGRLSCPVLSGALLAGLLPHPWPGVVSDAAAAAAAMGAVLAEGRGGDGGAAARSTASAAAGAAVPQEQQPYGPGTLAPYEAVATAALDQASVRALDDKTDAESVFAACAAGTLPPWTRHVVQEHVEWIEFLPYHLMPYASAHPAASSSSAVGPRPDEAAPASAAGASTSAEAAAAARGASGALPADVGGAGAMGTVGSPAARSAAPGGAYSSAAAREAAAVAAAVAALHRATPTMHPVMWYRFTEHAEYARRRLSGRARSLLRHAADLCGGAAMVLGGSLGRHLATLEAVVGGVCDAAELEAVCEEEGGEEDLQPGACLAAARRLPGGEGLLGAAAAALADTASTAEAGPRPRSAYPLAGAPPPPPPPALPSVTTALAAAAAAAASVERLSSFATAAAVLAPQLAAAAAGCELPARELQAAMVHSADLIASLQELEERLDDLADSYRELLAEAEADDEEEEGEDDEEGEGEAEATAEARAQARLRSWAEACREAAPRLMKFLSPTGALGPVGAEVRRTLAAALERGSAAAAAAAAAQPEPECPTVERRNEALLRRLPFDVPPPAPFDALQPVRQRRRRRSSDPSSEGEAETAGAEVGEVQVAAAGPSTSAAAAAAHAPPPAALGAAEAAALPAPHLDAPPPPGWACQGVFSGRLQGDVDAGRVVLPEADEDGHRVVHVAAQLLLPVPASAVVVKSVRPENLMGLVGWDDNDSPNVDVQYVALQGRALVLPPGGQACAP
ncbi:hypothetical protein HYH03_008242 [Edaphochlamys debaryana]|uniref:Uncharacterized protein n=1 Tax=Edaphochlamys debaryana TaxID=47281 RepID=A0A836BYY9_9CHLO|nr:hypothetical protein HYH03_008242 [Edaphochlamys debaryana]|eukprot:KAG2493422.1 hypothetical protein HYH03_008242 [Edaphochlamys debaryana]